MIPVHVGVVKNTKNATVHNLFMKKLEIGAMYEHYKGTKVKVLFSGFDSETLKPVVIYTHLEDGIVWVRLKKMFLENINVNGKKIERFKKIKTKILIKPRKK